MSAEERTGWRDEWISGRHRLYGFDAPMTDIDFLVAEYDKAEVQAIIEYKEKNAKVDLESPSIKALARMAGKADLPFFISVYRTSPVVKFFIGGMNDLAADMDSVYGRRWITEQEYIEFLYRLRGRPAPPDMTFDDDGQLR